LKASLLAAGSFSEGHSDERLVIANANGVGRVEKKARQGGMAEWGRRLDEQNRLQALLTVFKPSVSSATEYLIGQYVPDGR